MGPHTSVDMIRLAIRESHLWNYTAVTGGTYRRQFQRRWTTKGIDMGKLQKPGETPARPGEYEERGPRGGQVTDPRQVTIEEGDKPLPPTSEPGHTWERTGPPQP